MNDQPAPPALQRTLGGWQVLFYGLGSMLGAGIYSLMDDWAGVLGNTVWAGFLAAMVGALLTGLSYASLGSRHPRAGGAAYITQHAFRSPVLSTMIGIAVMMSGLTSMAVGLQAIAEVILTKQADPLLLKLLAVALAALVGGVIYRGIRESMGVNTVCTCVEACGLIFIIVVGCQYWGSVDYFATPPPPEGGSGSGLTGALLMQGAVLTFFSFIGFEDILNVSEEVKNPRRDVPFGLIGALVLGTIIYVGVAVTAVSVLGWEELSRSSAPLMDVARRAAPWFTGIDKVFVVITIFAIGNTALLNYLMGSRLLYGMGTQRLLPAALSRIHPRRHTPHIAIAVLLGIVTALIFSGGVKALAESTVILLLAVFACMNAALVVLKRRPGEPPGGFEINAILPALGALVCTALFGFRLYRAIVSTDPASRQAPVIALVILVIGAGIGIARRRAGAVPQ